MTKRLTIALVALALFVLVAVMPVAAYAVTTNISQGATVFIGEGGLNLTKAQTNVYATYKDINGGPLAFDVNNMYIGWWASAATLSTSAPTKQIALTGRNTSFTVAPSDFVGYTNNWYVVNQSTGYALYPAFFNVQDPSLAINVWDLALDTDMSGKSVVQGQKLGFKVDTNMYMAVTSNRTPKFNADTIEGYYAVVNQGYIDIKVKDESGSTLTALMNGSSNGGAVFGTTSLLRLNVTTQPWTWGRNSIPHGAAGTNAAQYVDAAGLVWSGNWSTAALDLNGQYAYPPGTYTVTAESALNGMKDNYKNAGADYSGKTVSYAATVTLVSATVKIEANKDSVVRSKPFSVTITGKPSTMYHVWVKGTSTMDGTWDNQPPMVSLYQTGVALDPARGCPELPAYAGFPAGNYSYQNGGGLTIYEDVAKGTGNYAVAGTTSNKLGNGTYVYANVTTSSSGTRTVEFTTTNWTKAQKYTVRVEQQFDGTACGNTGCAFLFGTGTYNSDEVNVKVEKGAVTIVAAGDQSYYLGEEIKFSGTNTESYTTYLFITGPNLQSGGSQIQSTNPRANAVVDTLASSFQAVSVLGDNTWSWKWGTSTVALDAGTYTIYAVSQPRSSAGNNLASSAYGTVSIIIKKPFVSATASQSTVAQGDKVFITGTAEGQPSKGVKIWVLGKNYPTTSADVKTEAVNSDGSFKYEVTQAMTRNLYPGQYFVVVQHPMQNNQFDIDVCQGSGAAGTTNNVCNLKLNANAGAVPTQIFALLGAGSLQGSDAAEALVQGINSANVDDTYTKLQFLVEVPTITINPIGDKRVGDKFTIVASTNLAVDDEILATVYSSSFKPTQKSQSGEFSGATGTVKVTKGDSGMNKISFDVDSSTFKPDEYIVQFSAVIQTATGTALFNVLEGQAPTAVPTTAVVTTAAPTPVPTTVVTTVAPTTVATTKSPGYGALIALIGLGAVAFIVVRRH